VAPPTAGVAPPTAGVARQRPWCAGGCARQRGLSMGSKMAAATRVVQVTALGPRPGAGRAADLAWPAAAGDPGPRRGGRCPWSGARRARRGLPGVAGHLMPVPGSLAAKGCRAARALWFRRGGRWPAAAFRAVPPQGEGETGRLLQEACFKNSQASAAEL